MTDDAFRPLGLAVLTVSDTRSPAEDRSGDLLVERLTEGGHRLAARDLVKDDIYAIRAVVSAWIASPEVQAILITGGTGFAPRDLTPEAVAPLLDRTVDGFGELFRTLSYQEIGTATIQSRALAGFANGTLVACLPGSTGACRTAWDGLLSKQLDIRQRPCNLAQVILLPPSQASLRHE